MRRSDIHRCYMRRLHVFMSHLPFASLFSRNTCMALFYLSVFATCDDSKLVIQITPFDYVGGSEFRGRIFGSPSDSFSSLPQHCTFSAAAGVYGLELSYDSGHRACGAPKVGHTLSDNTLVNVFYK